MPRITPCLWFHGRAEEAVAHYTSIFDHAAVKATSYYSREASKVSGMPEGAVLTISFELDGRSFIALNGSPEFQFTEALSLTVNCDSQAEVDHFWSRLAEGGEEGVCGWLKDRYGVSWQIVPTVLPELISHPDPAVVQRVMAALLQMRKIDIAYLQAAAQQEGD